jgi:hypothetical protein
MRVSIAGIEVPSDSPVFLATLAVHVPLGLLAVLSGAGAMLTEKKHGIHTRFGSIYFWSLGALFLTSAILAALRWSQDYHLFALGTLAFLAALIGRETRRHRWATAVDLHITAMGVSYIAMITAFYVDNGKNLPIWRDMPPLAYWLMPSAVGLPLMITALIRSFARQMPRNASTS